MGRVRNHRAHAFVAALLGGVSFGALAAHAQNATWAGPGADWNTNANWSPVSVPTGTAIFAGANPTTLTFSAATTNIDTIQFNAGAPAYTFTLGGSNHVLNVNGTGIVNNSSNAPTFNAGTIPFSGSGDVLNFLNASTAGNSKINIDITAAVNFSNSSTAGNSLITMSFGNLTFLNSSTAANATINNNFGVIDFRNSSTAANAAITHTGNMTFHDTTTAANATITINQGGSLDFFNSATAANSTITINTLPFLGALLFGNTSTAANANITITGEAEFVDSSTAANATIAVSNGGLFFQNSATAGNATITANSGAFTQFFDSSTAGNATITTNSGALTQFFDTSTGGNARFITNAGGVFDISGLTSAGMTAGSIEGAGSYFLGSKALTVGGNNLSTTVSGVISDCGPTGTECSGTPATGGSLIKVGTGTLTLSGTNTYTGATTVNAGILSVNGSIVASSGVTVNAGGTLGGTGALPKTTINPGGTLSPGNSIGTIAITGNLSFVGAGNYIVEVSPASADRTNASGTATLSGTLHAVGLGGTYTIGTKYTVINAAGVIGTFGSLDVTGSFGATRPHIEYDANNVYLVLGQGAISPFLIGGTPNQRAVAGAVDTALLAGSQAAPFLALFNLSSAQLPSALDALSGEVHASTAGVLVDESRYMRQAVLGRLQQASYGSDMGAMAALSIGGPQTAFADGTELTSALAYAKSPIVTKAPPMVAPSRDVVFWAQGFGAWGRFETDRNATTVRRDLAGFISGVDTRVANDGRLGFAAGYTSSRNVLDGRGSANVETGHIAAYGGWRFGSISLRAGAAYAFHTIDTDRTIAFPGFFDRATAHYDGGTRQVFGELGYGFALANIAVEPFAGAARVRLTTDAAAERGGPAALNVAGTTFEVGYATLGVRAASMIPIAHDMMLIPRGTLAWQHAFDNVTPTAVLAFQAAPVPFAIAGVPIARDALLAEAGLDLAIGRHATLGVSYVGQLAGNVQDHAAKGRFSWKF